MVEAPCWGFDVVLDHVKMQVSPVRQTYALGMEVRDPHNDDQGCKVAWIKVVEEQIFHFTWNEIRAFRNNLRMGLCLCSPPQSPNTVKLKA